MLTQPENKEYWISFCSVGNWRAVAVPPAALGDSAGTVSPSPCAQCTSFADIGRYWNDKIQFLPLHNFDPWPKYIQPVYSGSGFSSLCCQVEHRLHPSLLGNYILKEKPSNLLPDHAKIITSQSLILLFE